jgi:sialate O-acetylesterase
METQVTLTIFRMNDKLYRTVSRWEVANAENESIWTVALDLISDEEPLFNGTLVTITIHDVLFDDVWLCSDQSNMQMAVSMSFNSTEKIAKASKFPKIRLFTAVVFIVTLASTHEHNAT